MHFVLCYTHCLLLSQVRLEKRQKVSFNHLDFRRLTFARPTHDRNGQCTVGCVITKTFATDHGAPLIFSWAASIEAIWYHSFLRKFNHHPAAGPRSLPYLFTISDSSAALVGKLENSDSSVFSFD